MSDIGEMYNVLAEEKKEKKEHNREWSTKELFELGIPYESKNNGIHLIVEGKEGKIDFWPSTGKFIIRGGKSGRGIRNLIKHCRSVYES